MEKGRAGEAVEATGAAIKCAAVRKERAMTDPAHEPVAYDCSGQDEPPYAVSPLWVEQ